MELLFRLPFVGVIIFYGVLAANIPQKEQEKLAAELTVSSLVLQPNNLRTMESSC